MYVHTTFTKTIAKLQNKKKGRSTRTERRHGFETVAILNLNLLLPIARTTLAEIRGFMTMVGGEGIDF